MSLYTSRSEFDLEKRVHLTNEIPPYDMYDGLNSVLQTTLWQWVLGYTKVTFDLPYSINVATENEDGTTTVTKDRETGIENGEVYYKMVNGKVVEDVQYGPAESEGKNYHRLEEYGVLIPEFDFMLHEVYRYLGAMYPDHPDYTELLTDTEFDDMITSAGAVIDYEPDNKFFDKLASSLSLSESDELIESAMIKIRNLKNEGFRKRVYGSKLGYRMLANDIYQTATVFPIATYLPIKSVDKNKLIYESGKDSQAYYFTKNDDSSNTLYIIKEGDNVVSDLSKYKDDLTLTISDINGNVINDSIKVSELKSSYSSYQSPLIDKSSLQNWNTNNKKNYNETEYENYVRQNNRVIDTYSKYYYKKFRLVDYDGSNSSYPEPEDKSIYAFGYTMPGHDYDIIEYPATSDSESELKNSVYSSTVINNTLSNQETSYTMAVNDDVPVIETSYDDSTKTLSITESVEKEVHSIRTTNKNYVKYQTLYYFPPFKDVELENVRYNYLKDNQYDTTTDSDNKSVKTYKFGSIDSKGNFVFEKLNDTDNMLVTYYTNYSGFANVYKPIEALYNPYAENTLILKPSESLKFYPKSVSTYANPDKDSTESFFNGTSVIWDDSTLQPYGYLVFDTNSTLYKGPSAITSIEEVTNFTKGFIEVAMGESFEGLAYEPTTTNDDSYALVVENENGDYVVLEGSLSISKSYLNSRYYITKETLNIAAIPEYKTDKMLSLLYNDYYTYKAELENSNEFNVEKNSSPVTLRDKIDACVHNYGVSEEIARKYYSDDDDKYEEAKAEIKAEIAEDENKEVGYNSLLSFIKEAITIEEEIDSWRKNREYIYEESDIEDADENTFSTESTLINTTCSTVCVLKLSRPSSGSEDLDITKENYDKNVVYSVISDFGTGTISNMSLGNINVVCLYDYDESNLNMTKVDDNTFANHITVTNKDKVGESFDFYYLDVNQDVMKHNTIENSVTNDVYTDYSTQAYSTMDETFKDYAACNYSNNDSIITVKPQERNTIQIESVIDINTEGMENKISFESDEAKEAFKSLSVGDIITGPSIDSDDNDVFIIKIGDNEVTVNVNLQKSGTFVLNYEVKRDVYPTDVSDNLSQYKEDLYNNGLYEVTNPFEHGLWPSKDYPNVSNAILDSLPDISFYDVKNYWDNKMNSFTRVLEETHYDDYQDAISNSQYLVPSDIKFNNELFLELNLNKLLYYPTHTSETTPILMSVDWLDYIENSLMYSSRATDNVNVGVNVMMETDTTGYETLITGQTYTDPNIRLKFITLNLNGQNKWPEKTINDDDWTIPCYAQIGTGGKSRSRWFKSIDAITYPSVYGRTVFDDQKLDSTINEDSEFYRNGGEVLMVSVYGKDEAIDKKSSSSKVYTSVESPLFEIPLGEYDTIIKYVADNTSGLSSNLLSITQASFYSQTFTDLLKYFNDDDKVFKFIGSDVNTYNILTSINTNDKASNVFEFADTWVPTKVAITTDSAGKKLDYDAYSIVYPENPLNQTYYVVTEDVHLTSIYDEDEKGNGYTKSESFTRSDVLFRYEGKWYLKNFQYMGVLGDGLDTINITTLSDKSSTISRTRVTPEYDYATSEINLVYVGELQPYNKGDTLLATIKKQIELNPENFGKEKSASEPDTLNNNVYTTNNCIVKFVDEYYIVHLYDNNGEIGVDVSSSPITEYINKLFNTSTPKVNDVGHALYKDISKLSDIYNEEYYTNKYYPYIMWDGTNLYIGSSYNEKFGIFSSDVLSFSLEERLYQYYLRASNKFISSIELNTVLPNLRFKKNGLYFTGSNTVSCIEDAEKVLSNSNISLLSQGILYFMYIGTYEYNGDNENLNGAYSYAINRDWLNSYINSKEELVKGDRLAITCIEDNWYFFKVNTGTILGSSLPISRWQAVYESELNVISGSNAVAKSDGWDIQSQLDKFNTVIDLPRSYITEGSYNFDIILDPHFVADGYLYEGDTIDVTTAKTCQFCLTKGAIYYDEASDCFYCYANIVEGTDDDTGKTKFSTDVHKVAVKFNEQKYFKNVLNIAGAYQIKNATVSGETEVVSTPTFSTIDGISFPLEKLASGDRLLQVKSMDLRSIYSSSLEPFFFSSYFKFNYTIKGIAPYTGNKATGNYLYLSYLQDNADTVSELNFTTDISGLTPVSYNYNSSTGMYTVTSDIVNKTSLTFGSDVNDLTLYDIDITQAALSEDTTSSTATETLLDRNPAYYKNNLVVRGSVNSNNPNVIITPSIDSELFRSSLSNISVGDTLVSAYALGDTGSEENFKITIYVDGEAVNNARLKFVYFANNQFRAVTTDGTVYYNNDVEVSSVTSRIDCKVTKIFDYKVNTKFQGELISVGYEKDIGWYVEIALDKEASSDGYSTIVKLSIICQMYIDQSGVVTLTQLYSSNAKKVFVNYDSDTIKNVTIDNYNTNLVVPEYNTEMHTLVSHAVNEYNNDYDMPASITITFSDGLIGEIGKTSETIIVRNSTTTVGGYSTSDITDDLTYSVHNLVTGDWDYIEDFYKVNNDSVEAWSTTIMDNAGRTEYTTDTLTYAVPIRALYVDDDFNINSIDIDAPSFTWTYATTKRDTDVNKTILEQVFYLKVQDGTVNPSLFFYTTQKEAGEYTYKTVSNSNNKAVELTENGKKATYDVVVKVSNISVNGGGSAARVDYIFNVGEEPTTDNSPNEKFYLFIGGLYVGEYDNVKITKTSVDIKDKYENGVVYTVVATNILDGSITFEFNELDSSNTTWSTYNYNDELTYYTRQYNDLILTKLNQDGVVSGLGKYYNVLSDSVVEEDITMFYRDLTLNYAKLVQDSENKDLYVVSEGYSSEPYFAETLMTSNPNLSKNFLSDTIRTRAILTTDNSGKYALYAKGRSLFIKSPTSMVEWDDVNKAYQYCGKLTPTSYWKHANAPIFKDNMFMKIRSLVDARATDVDDIIKRSADMLYSTLFGLVDSNNINNDNFSSSYGITVNSKDIDISYKDSVERFKDILTVLYGIELANTESECTFKYLPTFENFKKAMSEAMGNLGNWTVTSNKFTTNAGGTSSSNTNQYFSDNQMYSKSNATIGTELYNYSIAKDRIDVDSNNKKNYYPFDNIMIKYISSSNKFVIRCYGFKLVTETVADDTETTGACKKTFAQFPYSVADIPFYYQDFTLDNDSVEPNYSYAYSIAAYYISYYVFGNTENTELITTTNINRAQFTNSTLLVFDVYGNVNAIGLSYLHNVDDIENPEHWSHSAMPNEITYAGKNPDITGFGTFKIPTTEESWEMNSTTGPVDKTETREYKVLQVMADTSYTNMSTFKSTCSYANDNVILLGGYTVTKSEFESSYLEMNSDRYPYKTDSEGKKSSERDTETNKLTEDTVYNTISENLKDYNVPMVLYSTNNGMSFDIMSLENTIDFHPWDSGNGEDYTVSSIICAENEFKIFVKKATETAKATDEDYYYYISQDDTSGLFDFSKTTDVKVNDEYSSIGDSHEYDIDSDTGYDDGEDSNGNSTADSSYLGKNNNTAALPNGSYKLMFTENESTFNILSRKGLITPLTVIGRTGNAITVSGNLVKRGNTTFDALLSFNVVNDIPDQTTYLNLDYLNEYTNSHGSLRVPEVTKVDTYANADRFYSYRELLSASQKNPESDYYDSYGYPAVSEDAENNLYEYTEVDIDGTTYHQPVTMINDSGNTLRLCDYSGKCLVYVNNNAKDEMDTIVLGTFAQRLTYPLELYSKAMKPLYDTIEEAQNATNARKTDDVLKKLLDFTGSRPISMCWGTNPYISIQLNNETSVPRDIREYLFSESDDLEAFVAYLKNTSGELTDEYSTDDDMLSAIKGIYYTDEDGKDNQRYTPKYVYSAPESSLMYSDNEQSSVSSGASSIVDHNYWFDNLLGVFLFKSKRYFEALAYVPYTFKKGSTAYKNYGFPAVWGDSRYVVDNPITGVYLSNYGYGGSRNNVISESSKLWTDQLPWKLDPDAFEDGFLMNSRNELVYLVNDTGKIIESYEAETLREVGDTYTVDSSKFNNESSKVLDVYSSEDSSNKYSKLAYNLMEGDISIFTPVSTFDLGATNMDIQLWVFKTNKIVEIDKVDGKYRISFEYYGRTGKDTYKFIDAGEEFSYEENKVLPNGLSIISKKIHYIPKSEITAYKTTEDIDNLKNCTLNSNFYVDVDGNIDIQKLYVHFYVDGKEYTVIYNINNWHYAEDEGKKGYANQGYAATEYVNSSGKKVRIFYIKGYSSQSIYFDKSVIYSNIDSNNQYTLMAQSISNNGINNDIKNTLMISSEYNSGIGVTNTINSRIMNCVSGYTSSSGSGEYTLEYNSNTRSTSDYMKFTEIYKDSNNTVLASITRDITLPIFRIGNVLSTSDIVYPDNTSESGIENYGVLFQTFTDNERIGSFKLENKYLEKFNDITITSLEELYNEILKIEQETYPVNKDTYTEEYNIKDSAGVKYDCYRYGKDEKGNDLLSIFRYISDDSQRTTDSVFKIYSDDSDLFCYTFNLDTRKFSLIVDSKEVTVNDCVIDTVSIPDKPNADKTNYFLNFTGDNGSVCYNNADTLTIKILDFNGSEYAEDVVDMNVYTNGTYGKVPCRKPKYDSFHDLVNDLGYVIDAGDDSILMEYDGKNEISGISNVDKDEGTVAFTEKLDLEGYNDGNEHYLLMKWLTQSTIKTELSMARDENSYTEVSLADKTIYTPDRVWFNPNGYSTPPVTIGNSIYNVENNSEFTKTAYKNNNNYSIYRCNEQGHIVGYGEVLGDDVLDYDTDNDGIPNDVEGYLTDENGNIKSAAVEFEINPNTNLLSDAQIPIKPNYDSCQDWFKNEFYIEGKESNPYWQVLRITSYFNASKMIWEQNASVNSYVKSSHEMILRSVSDSDRFINVSRTVNYENKNGNYIISTDSDLVNLKEGSLRFLLSKPESTYQINRQFIKYGITADNPFYKSSLWDGSDLTVAGYLKSTYTVGSTENLADPRDTESEVQEVTEMGLFNKDHQLIAYAIFPPIEYRTSSQHISFTCYVKQGSCLDPNS